MSLYALDALDEAMEKTKEMLFPFDLKTWTKFAIIAVLAGGVSLPSPPASFPSQTQTGDSVYTPGTGDSMNTFSGLDFSGMTGMATSDPISSLGATPVVIGVILLFVLIGGLFMYISSLFQFVFYQFVIDGKPTIIENMRKHAYKGLRYLGFQLGFALFILLTLLIPAGGFMANEILGLLLLVLVWLPVVFVAAIFSGLVHSLALPRMIEADEGLIKAWKSVWPEIRGQPKQVLAYIVTKLFVKIGIGIATAILVVIALLAVIIPFGILAFVAAMIHQALAALVIVLGVIAFAVLTVYISAPFQTYLYTYMVLFYHDLTS